MTTRQKIVNEIALTRDAVERVRTNTPLLAELERAATRSAEALSRGGKILWCGNGGSAADSQHLAAEFVVRFTVNRPGLASLALTVDTSVLTACSNDFGYETVFARQVEALGREGDVLIAISTSGNSASVLLAVEAARARSITTIAMTGESGGRMRGTCDLHLAAPSDRTQNIQECHIMMGHILCGLVEQELFPEKFAGESAAVADDRAVVKQ